MRTRTGRTDTGRTAVGRAGSFNLEEPRSSRFTTGRTVTFFPELNELARPTAARPVSCDTGGPAPGKRGEDRATG